MSNETREVFQRSCGRKFEMVSVKDQHYSTISFDVNFDEHTASVIGNVAHGGYNLPSGNKIEIMVDGNLWMAVPPTPYLKEGGLPFSMLITMLAEFEIDIAGYLEMNWYRPKQTGVRGSDGE